jgi:hypothetical protein
VSFVPFVVKKAPMFVRHTKASVPTESCRGPAYPGGQLIFLPPSTWKWR